MSRILRSLRRSSLATIVPLTLAVSLAGAPGLSAQSEMHGEHAHAMPASGLRAELAADLEALERKYLALYDVMVPHWEHRPAEGVRSVGEVFGHVAAANLGIASFWGHHVPEGFRGADAPETMARLQELEHADAATLREQLEHSFMHARHGIASVEEARMEEKLQVFGQEMTVRQVMLLLVNHGHEHLGQAIAYARARGVTPPWSGGGD